MKTCNLTLNYGDSLLIGGPSYEFSSEKPVLREKATDSSPVAADALEIGVSSSFG